MPVGFGSIGLAGKQRVDGRTGVDVCRAVTEIGMQRRLRLIVRSRVAETVVDRELDPIQQPPAVLPDVDYFPLR